MTIRERLKTIGLGLRGEQPQPIVKEIVKEVQAAKKDIYGGFLDFSSKNLSSQTKVSPKLMEANKGWVYRNNDVIAKEVATIEFELFVVNVRGGEIVYDPVLESPVLDLLDRFNEFTDASSGFYITQSHRKLTGDCFWYLDGNGSNIKSIYILPPDKVTIKLGKESGSMRIIEAYHYEDNIEGKRVSIDYDPKNVIHFKVPNPKNFYRGLSAVEAAADAIDTDTYAIEANRKLFERGLISNFILTTEKGLTPEQLKQLRAEFRAEYGGVSKAFTVPILSGGLKPETVQMSNKDLEFIAQQEWVRDKIASIFGNNKSVLGITDDVNRANAEATVMQWKRSTVRAEMKGICDTLNEFLVPRYGERLVLGFKDPVEDDEAEKVEIVVKKKNGGIISVNEAREELSYDPIDGGDEMSWQRDERLAKEQPVMEIPKSLKHVNIKRVHRRAKVKKLQDEYQRARKAALPYARELIKQKKPQPVKEKVKPSRFSEEQIMDYHNKRISIVDVHDKIFRDKVKVFIDRLVEKAIDQIPNEIQQMQKKALFDEEEMVTQAVLDFTPLLMGVARQSGKHALDLIDEDKPYTGVDLEPVIQERVRWFAKSMINTDQDKLVGLIRDGVQEGLSIPEIRNIITDDFSRYTPMQAERVARTEVLNASNQAAIDAWKQSGVVEGKEWLVASPIDECMSYSGDVVPLGKSFPQGDPPIHPNCECTLVPVLKGEKAYEHKGIIQGQVEHLKQQLEAYETRNKELEEFINGQA